MCECKHGQTKLRANTARWEKNHIEMLAGRQENGSIRDTQTHDVPGRHLLLGQLLNHLGAQVVNCLHLRRFQRQLAHFLPRARCWPVDLNLHHLSLDDFRLFPRTGETACPPRRAYLILTPMLRRNACVRASALLISCENSSLPASMVNGMSFDMALAMPNNGEGRGQLL